MKVCVRDGLRCSRFRSCCEFRFFLLPHVNYSSATFFYHLLRRPIFYLIILYLRWAAPTWPSSTPWATSATSGQSLSHSGNQIFNKVISYLPNKIISYLSNKKESNLIPFLQRFVDQITWKQCTSDFGDQGTYFSPFDEQVKPQVRNPRKFLAGANIQGSPPSPPKKLS